MVYTWLHSSQIYPHFKVWENCKKKWFLWTMLHST
jgi:hypothetical protein